jgi:hypothetical protein
MFSLWRAPPEPISPVIEQGLCTVVSKSTVSIPQLMNGAAISCSLIELLRASSILAELLPSRPITSLHSTLAAINCLALLGPIAAPTSSLTIIGIPSLKAQFSIAYNTKFQSRSPLGFISYCSGLI